MQCVSFLSFLLVSCWSCALGSSPTHALIIQSFSGSWIYWHIVFLLTVSILPCLCSSVFILSSASAKVKLCYFEEAKSSRICHFLRVIFSGCPPSVSILLQIFPTLRKCVNNCDIYERWTPYSSHSSSTILIGSQLRWLLLLKWEYANKSLFIIIDIFHFSL